MSGNGLVAPVDALLTINELNLGGVRLLLGPHQDPPYFDVNDDDYVTAQDVLHVINRLNAALDGGAAGELSGSPTADGDASSFPGSAWERTVLPALPAGCEGAKNGTGTGHSCPGASPIFHSEPRGPWVAGQSPVTRSRAGGVVPLWDARSQPVPAEDGLESILTSIVEDRELTSLADGGLDIAFEDFSELELLDLDLLAAGRGRR